MEDFLFLRACPVLCVSKEDLEYAFGKFGKAETLTKLAEIIIENYDFPYVRQCVPRVPPPQGLPETRCVDISKPQQSTSSRIGGYRASRLSDNDDGEKIPGITLMLNDIQTRTDWILDTFLEKHRMKCWVAVQGKPKRWQHQSDERNEQRSPFARATNVELLAKVIEEYSADLITHDGIRDVILKRGELIPPNTELYIQTLLNLKPTSIVFERITFGVGLAAAAIYCASSKSSSSINCSFNLEDSVENPEAAADMKEFVSNLNGGGGCSSDDTTNLKEASLYFIDAIPYGTHDVRAFLGEKSTPRFLSHTQHIRKYLIDPLTQIVSRVAEDKTSRVAIVISLKELSAQPTIEPFFLFLLSDEFFTKNVELVGALVSKQKDYAVFLIAIHPKTRLHPVAKEKYSQILKSKYPELFGETTEEDVFKFSSPIIKKSTATSPPPPPTNQNWEAECLAALKLPTTIEKPIPAQGPRLLKCAAVLPGRHQSAKLISETVNPETGDVTFVFGADVVRTPPPIISATASNRDPVMEKLIQGITANMSSSQK